MPAPYSSRKGPGAVPKVVTVAGHKQEPALPKKAKSAGRHTLRCPYGAPIGWVCSTRSGVRGVRQRTLRFLSNARCSSFDSGRQVVRDSPACKMGVECPASRTDAPAQQFWSSRLSARSRKATAVGKKIFARIARPASWARLRQATGAKRLANVTFVFGC